MTLFGSDTLPIPNARFAHRFTNVVAAQLEIVSPGVESISIQKCPYTLKILLKIMPPPNTITPSASAPVPPRASTPRSVNLIRVGSARSASRLSLNSRRLSIASRRAAADPNLKAKPPLRCPNPDCDDPDIQDVDGQKTCMNCGATVDDANIVSEVTFGESASGAAVVQGGYVGEGQRYAKTLGSAFRRGGVTDSREASEGTGRDEIRKIATFLSINNDSLIDRACNIYKLAVAHRFILGRRVRTVAAVSLYVSCRLTGNESTVLLIDFAEAIKENVFRLGEIFRDMRKELYLDPESTRQTVGSIPLIEVEELIHRYCMRLEFAEQTQRVANDAARILRRMKRDWIVTGRQPSGLCGSCIILAARMNNFRRTAREIAYVVKVTNMTVSKRLEEFRRTDSAALSVNQFRESALRIKKQNDPPVLWEARQKAMRKKRLEHMWHGPRGNPDQANDEADIRPSKRLRRDAEGFAIPPKPVQVDPALEGDDSGGSREPLADENGMPPVASTDSSSPKSKRGRPKGKHKNRTRDVRPDLLELSPQDLLDENELEREIEERITDEEFLAKFNEVLIQTTGEKASQKADQVRAIERSHKEQRSIDERTGVNSQTGPGMSEMQVNERDANENDAQPFDAGHEPGNQQPPFDLSEDVDPMQDHSQRLGFSTEIDKRIQTASHVESTIQTASTGQGKEPSTVRNRKRNGRWDIPSDPEISPSEFDEDPEVKYCRLSEADVRVKEKIWAHDNEQWLRAQQRKQLRKAIIAARDPEQRRGSFEASGGQENEGVANGGQQKTPKKQKRSRMGDGAIVREGGLPKNAAESVRRMVEKRSKGFSRFIDKNALDEHFKRLYERRRSSPSSEHTVQAHKNQRSREGSDADSTVEREGVVESGNEDMENQATNAYQRSATREDSPMTNSPAEASQSPSRGQGEQQIHARHDEREDTEPRNNFSETMPNPTGMDDNEMEMDTGEVEPLEGDIDLDEIAEEFGDEDENVPYYEEDEEIGFEGEEDEEDY